MASFVGHYEPRGTHWLATHAIDRIVALCGIVPYTVVAIILRLLVARDIFLAGQAKITGPTLFGGAAMLPTQVHGDILASFRPAVPGSAGFLGVPRPLFRHRRIHPADLPGASDLAPASPPRCYWSSPFSSKCISFPADMDGPRLLGGGASGADDLRRRARFRSTGSCGRSIGGNRSRSAPPLKPNVNFASDNTAPVAPAILDAIVEANRGFAPGYGNDDWTHARRAASVGDFRARRRGVSGADRHGGQCARSGAGFAAVGRRVLPRQSHIATDECGAPEFFGGGLKLVGLPGDGGKIALDDAAGGACRLWRPQSASGDRLGALAHPGERSRHHLSHRRNRGARRDSACTLARRAHGRRALRQCAGPAQRDAGADDLAIRRRCAVARRHQGRRNGGRGGGDLRSRPRGFHGRTAQARRPSVVQAPLHRRAIFGLARQRLLARSGAPRQRHGRSPGGTGSTAAGLPPLWPVEANLVFVALPAALDAKLKAAGAKYYVRNSGSLDLGTGKVLVRLVTSFATTPDEIDRFVGLCRKFLICAQAAPHFGLTFR